MELGGSTCALGAQAIFSETENPLALLSRHLDTCTTCTQETAAFVLAQSAFTERKLRDNPIGVVLVYGQIMKALSVRAKLRKDFPQ